MFCNDNFDTQKKLMTYMMCMYMFIATQTNLNAASDHCRISF